MRIKSIAKKIVFSLSIICFIIGIFGLFFTNNNSELNGPKGIVVDKEGNIYCGIINESKINIYDKNGRYIKSIVVDADGGGFKIKMENSELKVVTSRTNKLLTYKNKGNLFKEEENNLDYYSFGKSNEKEYIDKDDNVYRIKSILWLYPYIQKTTKTGESITLVSVPFSRWIFMKPIPAWLFMFIGTIILSPDLYRLHKRIKDDTEKD